MKTKHTPGPWSLDPNPATVWIVSSARTTHVAELPQHPSLDPETTAANAHLIAAAPEMLKALRVAEVALMPDDHSEGDLEALQIVRAAIARAEGSSQ